MALPTGSGTETLHAHHFNNTDGTQTLISGIKHHVYTVMSIIVYANVLNATTDVGTIGLVAHDGHAGSTTANIRIARFNIQVDESFVWNDKFSFNGYEPVDFTGPMDSEAKQDAIADQLVSGDSNRQILRIDGEGAGDNFDVFCTYIDQNNA